jgi:hypothetical protein
MAFSQKSVEEMLSQLLGICLDYAESLLNWLKIYRLFMADLVFPFATIRISMCAKRFDSVPTMVCSIEPAQCSPLILSHFMSFVCELNSKKHFGLLSILLIVILTTWLPDGGARKRWG